jgi:hypothetical protein
MAITWEAVSARIEGDRKYITIRELTDGNPSDPDKLYSIDDNIGKSNNELAQKLKIKINADRAKELEKQAVIDELNLELENFETFLNT